MVRCTQASPAPQNAHAAPESPTHLRRLHSRGREAVHGCLQNSTSNPLGLQGLLGLGLLPGLLGGVGLKLQLMTARLYCGLGGLRRCSGRGNIPGRVGRQSRPGRRSRDWHALFDGDAVEAAPALLAAHKPATRALCLFAYTLRDFSVFAEPKPVTALENSLLSKVKLQVLCTVTGPALLCSDAAPGLSANQYLSSIAPELSTCIGLFAFQRRQGSIERTFQRSAPPPRQRPKSTSEDAAHDAAQRHTLP